MCVKNGRPLAINKMTDNQPIAKSTRNVYSKCTFWINSKNFYSRRLPVFYSTIADWRPHCQRAQSKFRRQFFNAFSTPNKNSSNVKISALFRRASKYSYVFRRRNFPVGLFCFFLLLLFLQTFLPVYKSLLLQYISQC